LRVARHEPGGGHEGIEGFELGDGAAGERAGGVFVAAVVGGLAAAGLLARNFDAPAGVFEEPRRGKADVGPHRVHEAGGEEADGAGAIGGGGMGIRSRSVLCVG